MFFSIWSLEKCSLYIDAVIFNLEKCIEDDRKKIKITKKNLNTSEIEWAKSTKIKKMTFLIHSAL